MATISNSSEVVSKLKENAKELRQLQLNPWSVPFKAELEVMERNVTVTYEKIEVLTNVEKNLLAMHEIFQLYGIQGQCGKLLFAFKDLLMNWQDLYSSLGEQSNILDFVSGSLDVDIITLKFVSEEIEKKLYKFWNTRKTLLPRIQSFFLQANRPSINKLLTTSSIADIMPQVKKLVFNTKPGGSLEIVGYQEACQGSEFTFPTPIQVRETDCA